MSRAFRLTNQPPPQMKNVPIELPDNLDPRELADALIRIWGDGAEKWLSELADHYRAESKDEVFGSAYRKVLNRIEKVQQVFTDRKAAENNKKRDRERLVERGYLRK